jgi:hypothetical protein
MGGTLGRVHPPIVIAGFPALVRAVRFVSFYCMQKPDRISQPGALPYEAHPWLRNSYLRPSLTSRQNQQERRRCTRDNQLRRPPRRHPRARFLQDPEGQSRDYSVSANSSSRRNSRCLPCGDAQTAMDAP